MRLLVVALGSIGQAIAERLSDLAAGELEEQITYSFVNTDRAVQAYASGHLSTNDRQAIVVVPIKPLLGEMYELSLHQDLHNAQDSPRRFTPLRFEEMLEADCGKMANALSVSIDRGGLRELEKQLDKALYADTQSASEMRVVFVGAACDPLVVGGAPVLVDHVASYLQERYEQSINRMLLLLLSTDAIADAFPRKRDRERLREQEAKLVEAMGANSSKGDTRTRVTGASDEVTGELPLDEEADLKMRRADLASTYVIPATNARGNRLASAEDYCLLVAGMLLAELGGVWQKSLFEDGLECGHGFALVEYPAAQVEDYVKLRLTRDAISWWNHVDDLWLAGGWGDFGFADHEKGRFYQDELRHLSKRAKTPEMADCLRRLDESFAGSELAASIEESALSGTTEQRLACTSLDVLMDLAQKQVETWEAGDATTALGHPLPALCTLPQTVDNVREVACTCRTDEALISQWAASLNALERRLGCVGGLEAYVSSNMDDFLVRRDLKLNDLGLPAYAETLHPVVMRSMLYASAEVHEAQRKQMQDRAASLRRQIVNMLSDEIDLDATLGGVQAIRDVITTAPTDAADDDDMLYETEAERYDAWVARLAGAGYLLNLAALRMRELERALAASAVLAKTSLFLTTLSRQYERIFDGARRLEHRLEDEMRDAEAELSDHRGSLCRLMGTEGDALAEAVEACKERIEGYPTQHVSWKRLHRSLRLRSQGPLFAWKLQAESQMVHAEDADAELLRSILQRSSQGPEGISALVHELCDIDILSELGSVIVPEQQKDEGRAPLGILEEARAVAEPFSTSAVGVDTYDTLVAGRRIDGPALRNDAVANRYSVIDGMGSHRMIVCREAFPTEVRER